MSESAMIFQDGLLKHTGIDGIVFLFALFHQTQEALDFNCLSIKGHLGSVFTTGSMRRFVCTISTYLEN